jgi:23S rRNA (uracil1939-C5)-methyltransferase
MRQKQTILFNIERMDGLGQGVSKVTDKVTFIPKTVIGDQGEAEVMVEKKGVAFARVKSLQKSSTRRIEAECPHYNSCTSCHYQHVSYEDELLFKRESLERLFRKLPLPAIEVVPATKRLHYRNRMQLHYSLKSKLLGLRDSQTHHILPVPECLIGEREIANEINRLYTNEQWLQEAPATPSEGHVEIYWKEEQLKVSWNRPYAEGGFTQVFQEMNQKLKNLMLKEWPGKTSHDLLDLFGGNGNLSQELNYSERLCVDIYSEEPGSDFISQDIYATDALKKVLKEVGRRKLNIQQLLLDPPRSGLKNLAEWITTLNPQSVAYVSCDPNTLARDLQSLDGYAITKAFLIDFFPSTFHFETFIILERKS